MVPSRRTFVQSLLAGGIVGLAGCQSESKSPRTQRPPQKVRASIPESVDQTFEATVKEWNETGIRIEVTTTLTGASSGLEPTRMVIKFNEDNELQDEAVVSNPRFGETISVTLDGKIGTDETDVSLSSHTEFEPQGSLSIHYTKLLPKK